MKYAEIGLNLPIAKTFHYRIPHTIVKDVAIGKRVWVPFGKRRMVGYVISIADSTPVARVKDIERIIDDEPLLTEDLMRFTKWMSEYYCTSFGTAMEAAIPAPLKKGKTSVRERKREEEEAYPPSTPLSPTPEQAAALTEIKKAIKAATFQVFLLHGITSSGKTEVYLQCIDEVVKKGRSAVVLIPEISLTPQTVERFKSRFGDTVAIIHSQITGGRRFREWTAIRDGVCKIVVGARSALFSPVRDLGVIVIDEEHETSYKQEDAPRYHAREAAIERARIAGCPVILGSATPSLESYYRAEQGEYKLLTLTKRIDDRPLPKATVIDMKQELTKGKHASIISTYLRRQLEQVLKENQQAMLFLNRRGFATYVNCKNCGSTLKCKRCDAVLVYHSSKKELVCHYCNGRRDVPKICPECNSAYLSFSGKGTEKIESEIHRLFPAAGIDRMDTDVTRKKGSHKAILKKVKEKKTNILVGTQMIAKGHDFPQVTLVGVIAADVSLNIPDFRSSERTFNLLTQVGGRAGRGKDPGEVVIQSYFPSHYSIQAAADHDYKIFYSHEIGLRKELNFPPFSHIIKVALKSTKNETAKDAASDLAAHFKKALKRKKVEIVGPAPGVIPKVRNRYIWNVLVKTNDVLGTSNRLCEVLKKYGRIRRTQITVDVDPITL